MSSSRATATMSSTRRLESRQLRTTSSRCMADRSAAGPPSSQQVRRNRCPRSRRPAPRDAVAELTEPRGGLRAPGPPPPRATSAGGDPPPIERRRRRPPLTPTRRPGPRLHPLKTEAPKHTRHALYTVSDLACPVSRPATSSIRLPTEPAHAVTDHGGARQQVAVPFATRAQRLGQSIRGSRHGARSRNMQSGGGLRLPARMTSQTGTRGP